MKDEEHRITQRRAATEAWFSLSFGLCYTPWDDAGLDYRLSLALTWNRRASVGCGHAAAVRDVCGYARSLNGLGCVHGAF